jgi:hypothetical protein
MTDSKNTSAPKPGPKQTAAPKPTPRPSAAPKGRAATREEILKSVAKANPKFTVTVGR